MKKLVKNPWVFAIITGAGGTILVSILTLLWDYANKLPLLSTIESVWAYVDRFLSQRYSLTLYTTIAILLASAVIITFVRFVYRKISEFEAPKVSPTDDFMQKVLTYTSDTFDGVKYHWRWEKQFDDTYDFHAISADCTNCGNYVVNGKCIECNTQHYNMPDQDKLRMKVLARIKRKQLNESGDQ